MYKPFLGKLSKSQIQKAYGVLNELQKLIDTSASRSQFVDASNRFYTFIPHSFGVDDPPLLDSLDAIKVSIQWFNVGKCMIQYVVYEGKTLEKQ